MNVDSDRWKSMRFEHPEYIPLSLGLLGATWMEYREALEGIAARHPILFGEHQPEKRDYDAVGGRFAAGQHVDAWGCVWSNVRAGMWAIVTHHPVPTREAVHTLKMPEENEGFGHGFMYLRLCDLRGFEEIMVDFAEEPPELQMLIDIVLEYNMRQLEEMLERLTEPQLLYFGDDLGMQDRLPVSPAKWRKYLKPCFAKIYGRVHEAGHYVYMHSDGYMVDIIPDLIECGVDVVNAEVAPNGIDNLVRVAKGKVCLDVYPDVQRFPFFKPEEFDPHIREIVEKLGSPEGGLWIVSECTPDVPLENIEALCTALEKYRAFFR